MAFVRTFGTLTPSKPVDGVAVAIKTEGEAKVTDVQLVAGSSLFSWSPQVSDLHLKETKTWRFMNGIIQSDYATWVIADEDQASPYWGIIDPVMPQNVRWGMVDMGQISSREELNGLEYTTTAGAGVTPHHTARSDQRLDISTDGHMSVVIGIKGIFENPGDSPRTDLGTVTEAHPDGWAGVWGWHPNWTDVLTNHGGW
ncbi:hypothetical protein FDJ44_gp20 [Microbacterium phage Pikmin]|uniref:Uncharacterized protein n=3 Tax=Pikminvirus pikmin TaxID=2560596 RepID=A0A2P1CKF4_9CAUD|nr:hypothetical protein FDJ44_gp20 [Microbacterium phage Pikmin]AVJ51011.1 hypothetical protein PBI_PAJAZA_20 [Microbacterium phage Pajaza]AVJ51158.1 hypothetical protein PBI_PIKMIN_20 [Microbacterium phage Pikmin]AVJ51716.1 hypothetical protein PBI_CASEY_20 [Microbacterium phage Casey]